MSDTRSAGPALGLSLVNVPPAVLATKIGDVPAGFWLQVISEWGSAGERPGQQIVLPLERLLGNMGWLRSACQRHSVGIQSDPALDAILQQTRAQRRLLQAALSAGVRGHVIPQG